jgi:hypothetical protein
MGQEKAGEPGIGSIRVLMTLSVVAFGHVRPDSTSGLTPVLLSASRDVEVLQSRVRAIFSVEENGECTVDVGVSVSRVIYLQHVSRFLLEFKTTGHSWGRSTTIGPGRSLHSLSIV